MADIMELQSYDTRPFPRAERRRGALPAVVEAGVKQELSFMNAVYENVTDGILTQEQGTTIMWMLENVDALLTEATDIITEDTAETFCEILEHCTISDLPISGPGVLSKTVIYESGKPESIYKEVGWTRIFKEETDSLAVSMNRRMDYLENELHSYFESYGERGFESDGSIFYLESSDPDSDMFLKDYLNVVTEAATITDRISAEDGVAILSFLESCLMDEFTVAAMAPITAPEGEPLTKNPEEKKKKNVNLPENAGMTESVINGMLHASGWYTLEAATIYKNNITFDAVARKLFNNLSKLIKMSNPDDPNGSFKSALNMHKNEYKFSFIDNSNPNTNRTVQAAILATGFKPVKEGGKVSSYIMEKKPITITVEFETIDNGLDISYTGGATTESTTIDDGAHTEPKIMSLEMDNLIKDKTMAFCESAVDQDALENALFVPISVRVESIKSAWEEDAAIVEACDTLLSAMEYSENPMPEEQIKAAIPVVADIIKMQIACEAVLDAVEEQESLTIEASKEDIDPDIKLIIELLNRLGYKTKYSSAGHREERSKDDRDKDGVYYGKLYTTARLTFDKNYNFKKLPKGWYQNFNSDKTGIYVKPLTYNEKDGSPDEAFAKWRTEYIANLKDWAENLEDAKDTKSDKDSEEEKSED